MGGLDYRVLGPIDVVRDGGTVTPGSAKLRSLLALLLIHAGEVVSTDRIIDALWGDDFGTDRQNALWVLVSNLRSVLEPERPKRSAGSVLVTRAPGYTLHVEQGQLDSSRFEALVREGRSLLDGDPGAASMAIGAGLALWRGRAYDDVTYESFAQSEIGRLEELRMEAVELRIDADLRQGLAAELVGELEGLVREHPLRERLATHLMLALYRSGRLPEALRVARRLTSRLAEEIGVDPSEDVRRLEARMLEGDPTLHHDRAFGRAQARLAVRGYELRDELGGDHGGVAYEAYQPAQGRSVVVKVIDSELADDPGFIRRFESDAERVARLDHPHLVPLYDYWREPHAAFIVTPSLPEATLEDMVRSAPLPAPQATELVLGLASALAVAHREGVVHGNVEPGSIRVEGGAGYLTGFAVGRPSPAGARTEEAPPSAFAAPEVRGGPPTPMSDVYGLGRVLQYALTGSTGDGGSAAAAAIPPPLADVIARATSTEPDRRHHDAAAFAEALGSVTSVAPSAAAGEVTNPYKGLRSFEEADAADFFGRERVVERLVARLGERGSRGRFLAVVGPSGSGKSSVVKAGLVPALRRGALPGSADWFVVDLTPGAQPYEALEDALRRIAVNPPPALLEQLSDGDAGIRRAVRRLLPSERSVLLIVIDQLEELFTRTPPGEAQAFLSALASAVDDAHSYIRVVATLRADFYDRPLRHRLVGELVRRGTEVITPLSPAELERAISGPAERRDVHFEPGLVAEMVAEVADREGSLPLLQYALAELFDRRRGSLIELAVYRELGGVSQTLVRRAERLYAALDPGQQAAARQTMLRLVELADGGTAMRRRVLRQELSGLGDPSVDHVLDLLGRHRLVTFDRDPVTRGPTVEVAHESLLTEWGRLRAWIDEGREDVRQQRRLASAADEWEAAGRDAELLLAGSRLDQVEAWAAGTELALGTSERTFLAASVTRRSELAAAERARQEAEARLLRGARRRSRLLVVGAVVMVVVVALAIFALTERTRSGRQAREQDAIGEARRLAAASTSAGRTNPELGMLLGLQSLEVSAREGVPAQVESQEALHWSLQGARVPYPVVDGPVRVRSGPDGPVGIQVLPLPELVDLARSSVTRTLSVEECARYGVEPCSADGAGLASPSAHGDRTLPASASPLPESVRDRPLEGTNVTIGGVTDLGNVGVSRELDRFFERTGIRVSSVVETPLPTPPTSLSRTSTWTGADIMVLPQPGLVREQAGAGNTIDLGAYIDVGAARRSLGDYLVDANSSDTGYYGIPLNLDLKGLVWYPRRQFEEAGYEVPATWDDLVGLSRQMAADGRTPWCIGFEDGSYSGWPGTDWIEALVLRTGGADTYDRWITHDVTFGDPAVRTAMRRFGDIAFGEGFVRGGAGAIGTTARSDVAEPLVSQPPGCWMTYQGSFLATQLPGGATAGRELGFFVLPPITAGGPAHTLGAGSIAVAVTDRPEVREFMRSLLDPEWGSTWAADKDTVFLSANLDFDPTRCRSTAVDEWTNELRVALCGQNQAALVSGRWRYDASDQMPTEVGGVSSAGRQGAFLRGMLDYVDQGPGSLDRILATIDASWPP